ncbi:unnamed protein product [Moneuplotes crassus]|uniref:SANT and BTB domain-containing protein n=1 Tax=Euplotes crassus TaxID=5936 RepID=A0AAD2DD09_EUPCR|nr:unnamed protein product [Moneuplotes crassus]
MRKRNDYLYQRRGFGAHTRLDPLVGKSPSNTGVTPKLAKPKTLISQSLHKENRMTESRLKPKENSAPTSYLPKKNLGDELIIIKVTDERKNINKNFELKSSLLRGMKYFDKHLKSTDSAEDIDISIHCDVTIFEWLMSYIKNKNPRLSKQNVIPILISAEFLIIKRLTDECIEYIVNNISEIVKVPIDMNCLSRDLVKKLADSMTLDQLDEFKDSKDSLQSKLYAHKLDDLMKVEKNKLSRCIHCNILYTEEQSQWMTCPKAGIYIDYRGRVISKHVADANWSINEFLTFMNKNVSWRHCFWKIWARLKYDECTFCGQKFVYSEYDHCTYHPEAPEFQYGSNTGTYPCCQAEAVRFTTSVHKGGCKNQRHIFKNLQTDSREYYFLSKHYELFKEPVIKPSTSEATNENKSTHEECESKNSEIKSKMMSLLTLVKEFSSGKYLKLRNKNCLKCAQCGTCCNECLMIEEEDDNTPDFNFVLPKKLQASSHTQLFRDESYIKQPNTKNLDKYKLWKYDYFRDKDRDAMIDIAEKLKKQRTKVKSPVSKPSKPLYLRGISKSSTKASSKMSFKSSAKSTPKVGYKSVGSNRYQIHNKGR